jgi:hypothetical protein
MSLTDGEPLAITKDTREWSGLAEPPRHGSITDEKVGNLGAGQPVENPIPFQKDWPDASTIASHPAAEIAARKHEHARMAAEFGGDRTILGRVDPINDPVRPLLHSSNIATPESSRNNICKDSPKESSKRETSNWLNKINKSSAESTRSTCG